MLGFWNKVLDRFFNVFRGFKNRNYSLYFFGQGTSLIGTWIQRTAMSWLIYRLTGSVFWLGFIGFIGQIPSLIVTPFAGVIADKVSRHKILKISQTFCMIQASLLTALVFFTHVQIWQIMVLSVFLGFIEAFESPVRHSFVIDMIDNKSEIGNAIALNSAMFNGARLVGPGIAGFMVAQLGEGYCFLINAMSYLAVLASLFSMRIKSPIIKVTQEKILTNLKEGFLYVKNFEPIKILILNLSIFTLFGTSYTVLLPYYAKDVFHGNAKTLGYLMSSIGLGALLGAIYLASRKSPKGLVAIIANLGHLAGICLVLVAISTNFYISMGLVAVAGFSMMMQMAGSNTIVQSIVDEDKRGRVMGIYSMSFLTCMPIGSLLVGSISKYIGVEVTLICSGAMCFFGSFLLHAKVKVIREKIREHVRSRVMNEE